MALGKGTKVSWSTPQGETEGTVVEERPEDFELDGRTYRASPEEPHYVVESARTGTRAAHRADAPTER